MEPGGAILLVITMSISCVNIGSGRYFIFFEYEDGTVDFMEISS